MTEEKESAESFTPHRRSNSRDSKMIDEEKECIDVITQLSAVRSSIDRVMGMIVAENLKHCFENPEKDPKEQEERLAQAINMIVSKTTQTYSAKDKFALFLFIRRICPAFLN